MKMTKIGVIACLACLHTSSFAQVSSENFDIKIVSGKDNFTRIWSDAGSGAEKDVSIWRPKVPAGYFSLGDVVLSVHMADDRDKNANIYTMVIKPKPGKEDLLAIPEGTTDLWTDAGSGADEDVIIKGLKCKEGYNALGVIANNLPAEVRCVKDSETARGSWGSASKKENPDQENPVAYWTDAGSKADEDVSFWRVRANEVSGDNRLALSPNTFYASDKHDKTPTVTPYGLLLTFNVSPFKKGDTAEAPQPKYLPNGEVPQTFPSTTKTYKIPFFLVQDNRYEGNQIAQMAEHPEYEVTRTSTYEINTQSTLSPNGASLQSQITTGTNSQKNKTWSAGVTAGLSVMAGGETGVIGVANGRVEVTASVGSSFSYSWGGLKELLNKRPMLLPLILSRIAKASFTKELTNMLLRTAIQKTLFIHIPQRSRLLGRLVGLQILRRGWFWHQGQP